MDRYTRDTKSFCPVTGKNSTTHSNCLHKSASSPMTRSSLSVVPLIDASPMSYISSIPPTIPSSIPITIPPTIPMSSTDMTSIPPPIPMMPAPGSYVCSTISPTIPISSMNRTSIPPTIPMMHAPGCICKTCYVDSTIPPTIPMSSMNRTSIPPTIPMMHAPGCPCETSYVESTIPPSNKVEEPTPSLSKKDKKGKKSKKDKKSKKSKKDKKQSTPEPSFGQQALQFLSDPLIRQIGMEAFKMLKGDSHHHCSHNKGADMKSTKQTKFVPLEEIRKQLSDKTIREGVTKSSTSSSTTSTSRTTKANNVSILEQNIICPCAMCLTIKKCYGKPNPDVSYVAPDDSVLLSRLFQCPCQVCKTIIKNFKKDTFTQKEDPGPTGPTESSLKPVGQTGPTTAAEAAEVAKAEQIREMERIKSKTGIVGAIEATTAKEADSVKHDMKPEKYKSYTEEEHMAIIENFKKRSQRNGHYYTVGEVDNCSDCSDSEDEIYTGSSKTTPKEDSTVKFFNTLKQIENDVSSSANPFEMLTKVATTVASVLPDEMKPSLTSSVVSEKKFETDTD